MCRIKEKPRTAAEEVWFKFRIEPSQFDSVLEHHKTMRVCRHIIDGAWHLNAVHDRNLLIHANRIMMQPLVMFPDPECDGRTSYMLVPDWLSSDVCPFNDEEKILFLLKYT